MTQIQLNAEHVWPPQPSVQEPSPNVGSSENPLAPKPQQKKTISVPAFGSTENALASKPQHRPAAPRKCYAAIDELGVVVPLFVFAVSLWAKLRFGSIFGVPAFFVVALPISVALLIVEERKRASDG